MNSVKKGFTAMKKEFDTFREKMICKTSSEVFDASFEINAMKAFHSCMTDNQEDETVMRILQLFDSGEMSLSLLYDEYLSKEFACIDNYSETIDFFKVALKTL